MKNTIEEKGITLISLIITIIVLLILALVSISAVQNQGIIEHANGATTRYQDEVKRENQVLQSYEKLENKYINGDTEENVNDNVSTGNKPNQDDNNVNEGNNIIENNNNNIIQDNNDIQLDGNNVKVDDSDDDGWTGIY